MLNTSKTAFWRHLYDTIDVRYSVYCSFLSFNWSPHSFDFLRTNNIPTLHYVIYLIEKNLFKNFEKLISPLDSPTPITFGQTL